MVHAGDVRATTVGMLIAYLGVTPGVPLPAHIDATMHRPGGTGATFFSRTCRGSAASQRHAILLFLQVVCTTARPAWPHVRFTTGPARLDAAAPFFFAAQRPSLALRVGVGGTEPALASRFGLVWAGVTLTRSASKGLFYAGAACNRLPARPPSRLVAWCSCDARFIYTRDPLLSTALIAGGVG